MLLRAVVLTSMICVSAGAMVFTQQAVRTTHSMQSPVFEEGDLQMRNLEVTIRRRVVDPSLFTIPDAPAPVSFSLESMADHLAEVFSVTGSGEIMRSGSDTWEPLRPSMQIREGDHVRTDRESRVEIFYDGSYQNTATITPGTLAEFVSIEPTRIEIRRGEMLNRLDALPSHMAYQVATPSSVSGIVGTRFARAFDPVTRSDSTRVEHGEVRVVVGTGELTESIPIQSFEVGSEYELSFTPEDAAIQTRPLDPASLAELTAALEESRGQLTGYIGSEEVVRQAADSWQSVRVSGITFEDIQKETAAAAVKEPAAAPSSPQTADLPETGREEEPAETVLGEEETAARTSEAPAEDGEIVYPEYELPEEVPSENSKQEIITNEMLTNILETPKADKNLEADDTLESAVNVCERFPEKCGKQNEAQFCSRFPDSPSCQGK